MGRGHRSFPAAVRLLIRVFGKTYFLSTLDAVFLLPPTLFPHSLQTGIR
ncbi:hypothetical protein WCP94_000650 (plasmid) [Bilophila wadsworthia]